MYATFAELSAAGLIDDRFSSDGATVDGYTYLMPAVGTNNYVVYALASASSGSLPRYNYYIGPDGVARYLNAVPGESLPQERSLGNPVG